MSRHASSKYHDFSCAHSVLTFSPSPNASLAGYTRPTPLQRTTAARLKKSQTIDEWTFPAPLVLPNDDLAYDVKCPAQSLRSWIREKDRNEVTAGRKTIYIAAPPEIAHEVRHNVASSSAPLDHRRPSKDRVPTPPVQDLVSYMAAFFHGLPVKLLSSAETPLRFTTWDDDNKKKAGKKRGISNKPSSIALATSTEATRIRARPCPDGAFPYQLNLNDILDVVISILPTDAYCLLLLIEQDMYEEDDDDYCCGRAYGGSRCAVVTMARYNPALQDQHTRPDDRRHTWPASHCEAYINAYCEERKRSLEIRDVVQPPSTKRRKVAAKPSQIIDLLSSSLHNPPSNSRSTPATQTPLHAAVTAYTRPPSAPETLTSLWLSHIARTASHELGHCFGIDHCVYYACVMQSTASMAEDQRQPPYLCPVDLSKLGRAICDTGDKEGKGQAAGDVEKWERERYEKLLEFCKERDEVGLWRGFGGWLRGRLRDLYDATDVDG
ncbi:MAG: hypothetical protein Q9217_001242 [Psora testacea]